MPSESDILRALFATPGDARRAVRSPFAHAEMVAVWTAQSKSPLVILERVDCRDISRTGIAFFWHKPPDFRTVLLGLGDESRIYVTARVVRWNQGYWDGQRKFLVGCEFTGRVAPAVIQAMVNSRIVDNSILRTFATSTDSSSAADGASAPSTSKQPAP